MERVCPSLSQPFEEHDSSLPSVCHSAFSKISVFLFDNSRVGNLDAFAYERVNLGF